MRPRIKPRGLRALLLLPTLTVGSLAAGGLFTQLPAQATATSKIEICKANTVTGTFNFTIMNAGVGNPVSVAAGACSAGTAVTVGRHKITEAPTAGMSVQSITSFPSGTLVSSTIKAGTATVAVAAGEDVIVTYTNQTAAAELKVCKEVAPDSTQLEGLPFSFSVSGGPAFRILAGAPGLPNCHSVTTTYASGTNVTVTELQPSGNVHVSSIAVSQPPATNVTTSLSARTASLTLGPGVNVVDYTNEIDVTAQKGLVEICKNGSDEFVYGNSFSFTITDAAGLSYGPFSVLTGQCTSAITVTQGPATITEAAQAPFYVDQNPPGVTAYPNNLISQNDINGTAIVDVVSTDTTVSFNNDTELGYIKVCKALDSANSNALAGTPFYFYSSVALSTGGSLPPELTTVYANSYANGPACVFINSGSGLPLGSIVTISESPTNNVANLSGTQTVTVPGTWNPDGNPGNNVSQVIFTNQAEGTIEICKDAADSETLGNGHNPFKFVVNGSINVTVNAGQCSRPIAVPAGTATVDELATLNFHEVSVTATGPTNDNRILFGTGVAPDLNPITVSVPFSGTSINGNETLVTYTNAVNTGVFKICKQSSSSTLLDESFVFNWSYTLNNTPTVGQVTLSPGECGYLNGSLSGTSPAIPVVGNSGAPVTVSVSGDTDTTGGIWVLNGLYYISSISFTGPGLLTSSDTYTGASSFTIGQGTNVLTYDNEACDSNGCPGAPTGRAS